MTAGVEFAEVEIQGASIGGAFSREGATFDKPPRICRVSIGNGRHR